MGALRAFAIRVFIGYFLVLGGAAYFALDYFSEAVKPAVRQTIEELLVEEAHLLATVLEADAAPGGLVSERFRATWSGLEARPVDATIYGVRKTSVAQRVYVTDAAARVVFDSSGRDEGADYSRWNDVTRTLRGEYGARTTKSPETSGASMLYVAAPIRAGGAIIGVVSVGKLATDLDPFVQLSRARLLRSGALVFVASLAIGLVVALVLSRSISRLVDYAKRVARGERAVLPAVGGELRELAAAVDTMRTSLEGKQYVEKTIQTMAHELKSPLTAIVGAAELLEGPVEADDRRRFARQVSSEARRMQAIVERLLELAVLEQRRSIERGEDVLLEELVARVAEARAPQLRERDLSACVEGSAVVRAERVLLEHAISNLLDNAIEFAAPGSELALTVREEGEAAVVAVSNAGPQIPDFARDRLFERFYSLPRPDTDRRSTGLGLPFVRQVAELHGGTVTLENTTGGVVARLTIPAR